MSSFSIPLTGLEASSEALNTIANNLSNMNTTAFKAQNDTFSDLFYQELGNSGSGNPLQVGAGVQVASTTTDFTEGSVDQTGNTSDVYLTGNGFFMLQSGGNTDYTRDGSFTQNAQGFLTSQGGLEVMGYQAANGVINTNGVPAPIQLPTVGQVQPPSATTTMSLTTNLDATAAVGASFQGGPVKIFDSLGEAHSVNVDFTKTGTNTWSYSLSMADPISATSTTAGGATTNTYTLGAGATLDPSTNLTITGATVGPPAGTATIAAPTVTAGESMATYATDLTTALNTAGITGVTATATGNTLTVAGTNFSTSGSVVQDAAATNATGTLNFDASGNLTSPATNVAGIQFSGLTDGAANLNLTLDTLGTNGKPIITQDAGTSAVSSQSQNGFATGQYQGFTVGADGTITATYSNGQTPVVGQLALANITNPQGLEIVGGNNFVTTQASGAASVGTAGSDGLGTLQDGALEASNVNISTQFSDLIVAQQAYEASSKAITTFDTVSQDTINMIH
jgi:flagellar hook protein FlgE